jgi:threonine dehydrogenase-like Zn-dependent dehydrogenase
MAMALTAPGKLEPISVPIPDVDDNSALLRIEACGICGTDCEQFATGMQLPMPHIPGHEPLGIIEEIGDGAARRWGVDVGDRVAVETLHAATVVHRMDKSIPAELAVMFNPLGAGFRWAVEIPKTGPGDSILIMGPGQRGLSAVVAAAQAGAKEIIVTGLAVDAAKLDLAREFGATHTIDVQNESIKDRVKEITQGQGVDIVLDVTPGATKPVEDAISVVRIGGTVVLAGVKGYKRVADFISDKIVFKELRLLGAFGVTSSGYKKAIDVIQAGKVPLYKMHTHQFPVEQAEQAIRTLAREIPGDESIHSCLIPEH